MPGPLEGIRVLDFTIAQQGPYATLLLSHMGAEVIKVEIPGRGDVTREIARDRRTRLSYCFLALNLGKKSVTINLKSAKGRQLVLDLVQHCDVVVENFNPGVMERLGLSYETLRAVNPRIIYASASAFGTKGPWGKLPGVDLLAQAMGGLMSVTGYPGEPPHPVGAAVADHIGAVTLALGVVAALVAREHTGQGQKVETSLLGSIMAAQSWEIAYYLNSGESPSKAGRGHSLVPHIYGVYRTADGFLAIGTVPIEQWEQFCQAIGLPHLASDPRFARLGERLRRLEELRPILDDHFSQRPTEEWVACLRAIDIPAGPVLDYIEMAKEEQVHANRYLVQIEHPRAGEVTVVNVPIQFSATPGSIKGPEPELGQHTEEVLSIYLGLSAEEIATLRADGVI